MALKMVFIVIDGRVKRAMVGHRSELYAINFYNNHMNGRAGKVVLADKRLREHKLPFGTGYYYELEQSVVTNEEIEIATCNGWEIIQ